MEQIVDFMKQLYEHFYLEKNEIKKLQKNISSELLASFGRQLTGTEDIEAQNLYIFLIFFNEGSLQLYDVDNFLNFRTKC